LLHEDVATLLAFFERAEMAPALVRSAYRRAVDAAHGGLAAPSPEEPDALDRAAATVMQERGIAALTFRNVAAQAGTTLGRTAWHFGSKTTLLERAFEQLYRDVAGMPPLDGSVTKEEMLAQVIAAVTGGTQPILRAFDEIILHIARSPDHMPLRGAIRVYRDPAATWVLNTLLADAGPVPPSLASVFSSICRGLDHYSLTAAQRPDASAQQDYPCPAPSVMAEQVLRGFLHL
jgi:AcrR family transcriptional regulator